MGISHGAAGSRASALARAEYLLEKQVDDTALRSADYYSRTEHAEAAIAAGVGCLPIPRADMAPDVARALGIDPAKPLDTEGLANLLSGLRADGGAVEGAGRGVGTYKANEDSGAADRHEVAYRDLTFSAPKGLSVAWALAETDAERASLLRCHQTAVAEAMAYVEDQVGWARSGKDGKGARERARFGWVTCQHYTARPTLEAVRVDPETGQEYTEPRSLTVTGDPQLHTHVVVPNVMVTDSGRVVAMDGRTFHGRKHEFGAVYQALLARELRAMGVDVVLDERTGLARLPAVPEWACDAYSKRTRDAEDAAKARATAQGRDYETLTPAERSALLSYGARATRRDKESNRPDFEVWREQAERIGYEHRGVVGHGPTAPERTEAERMAAADRAALPHLADMLSKSAVIGAPDARLAAARGFIAEGMGASAVADMGAMMRQWAAADESGGVVQDGAWTKLVWHEMPGGRVRITTELHRDQEQELIDLARRAAADRTHALTPEEIAAGVSKSGIGYGPSGRDPTGEHGARQRAAVESLGTDGGLAVVVGVAGSGKTRGVLPPLVAAWQARGFDVWGTGQRWSTATDLTDGGIEGFKVRALSVLLDGVERGQTKLTRDSVVVVDELGQIGTRELLHLLRLRERIGFKIAATGDDQQCSAIEAGPTIELLRRALGAERIPEILSTVRQASAEERRMAGLFRKGEVVAALAAKRADGTAEMVAGGYREAVRRVAELYAERRRATHNQPDYRITISAPTNADAREIGREVRAVRRAMGEITGPDHRVSATDGRGDAYALDLAAGDRVRLYARTRGTAVCTDGRRRGVSVGDNGSVLTVLGVLPAEGLRVRTDAGTEAFVPWTALRDRGGTGRVLLAHGDCLTIDSSQGLTSDEHINAMPAGSRGVTGFKAYVAQSRHRVRSHMVLSEGAEMREVRERRAAGLPPPSHEEARKAAWANTARNLARKPAKESALAFLESAAATKRASVTLYQGVHRRQEARVAADRPRDTLRAKAGARAMQAALPALAGKLDEAARQRAAAAASLRALREHHDRKTDRRAEMAARMVLAGHLGYSEAVERLVSAETGEMTRALPVDPVHGIKRYPPGMEDITRTESRVAGRLDAALDGEERRAAERAQRTAARPMESRAASVSA